MKEKMRNSGVSIIGNVPWGTHFCQFYQSKKDLTDILIPYFEAGLENNELCIWVTSEPLEIGEVKEALKRAVPEIDAFLENGQMEIIPYDYWYAKEDNIKPENILNGWTEKLDQAFDRGYEGLRITGNIFGLEKEEWGLFAKYEKQIDNVIGNYPILALCSYSLDRCSATEIMDVIINHQFALVKREGKWEKIENSRNRRTEEALRESEKRLQEIIDGSSGIIFVKDLEGRFILINKRLEELLGITRSELKGKTDYDIFPSDWADYYCAHDCEVIIKGEAQQMEEIADLIDGRHIFLANKFPLYDSRGKPCAVCGISTDITERKKAEEALYRAYEEIQVQSEELQTQAEELMESNEALVRSENKFRTLAENCPDVIARFDRYCHHIYANKAAAGPYGRPPEEIIGRTNSELGMDPDNVKLWENSYKKVFNSGKPEVVEFGHVSPQGKKYYFNTRIVPEFESGKVVSVLAISRDITDMKMAEAALKNTLDNLEQLVEERTAKLEKAYMSLKENEKSLAEAQKIAHVGNWNWNLETGEVYWSDEVYRICGCNPREFITTYDTFLYYIHPEDLDSWNKWVQEALSGNACSIDHRIILSSGEEKIVHVQAEVFFDSGNRPVRMTGIVQDITERKKSEQEIRESEEKYRSFLQNFKGIFFQKDEYFALQFFHGAVEKISGYTEEEFKYEISWKEIVDPEYLPLVLENENKMKEAPDTFSLELEYRIKDRNGKEKWIQEFCQKIPPKEGKPEVYQGILYDITEKKEAEVILAKTEEARKKEIHHRIKNNLQVVSSLLDLEAERFACNETCNSSRVLEAFRNSQNRVSSMALIHEELYGSREISTLDFAAYLKKLTADLFRCYNLGDLEADLQLEIEEETFFDMDTAVPLGIIVNELVSNSLKHAFPEREKGTVKIKLCREDGNSRGDKSNRSGNENEGWRSLSFILTVSDDGIGIPEHVSLENADTLGIQLVSLLVDQLEGELELRRDPGTKFLIKFTVT